MFFSPSVAVTCNIWCTLPSCCFYLLHINEQLKVPRWISTESFKPMKLYKNFEFYKQKLERLRKCRNMLASNAKGSSGNPVVSKMELFAERLEDTSC